MEDPGSRIDKLGREQMARVYLAVSYDTEHAVPQQIPTHILDPKEYQRMTSLEKSAAWGDYLNRMIWKDPDHLKRSIKELAVLEQLAALYSSYEYKFTAFVLGRWLEFVGSELGVEQLRSYFRNVAEVGSHSFDHRAFQSAGDPTRESIAPTMRPDEAEDQISRSIASINTWLRRPVKGLRTPMGNIRPFGPEERGVLEALRACKLNYVSSWLKAGQRVWNKPGEANPFDYGMYGFSEILEIPGVGAYDVHFVQPTKQLVFGEEGPDLAVRGEKMEYYYTHLLEDALRLARKGTQDVFVPLVFHPHAVQYYDPDFKIHTSLLHFCRTERVEVVTYDDLSRMH